MELRLIRSSPHSELPVRQVQPCVAKRGSERAAGAKSARESVCFVFSDSALSGVVSVKLSPKRADRFPHYATAQTHCCSPKVSPLIPQQQEGRAAPRSTDAKNTGVSAHRHARIT